MRAISEKDRIILSVAQYYADESTNEASKLLGLPESQVRRTIQKLESQGTIKRVVYINTASLGYRAYTLYAGLHGTEVNARDYFRRVLAKHPNLENLIELGGEYQFLATYFAKTTQDFTEFLHELSGNVGNTMARRVCGERVYWEYSGVKHLCSTPPPARPVRMGDQAAIQIDQLDFKILLAFSTPEGNRISSIAQKVGTASTTVAYRLDRLRDKQIIRNSVYWINPAATGASCFRLHIVFRSLTRSTEAQLLEYCRTHPNILTCVRLVGG